MERRRNLQEEIAVGARGLCSTAVRQLRRFEYPLGVALCTTIVTYAFGVCAFLAFEKHARLESWLAIWNRWDTQHFVMLAQHGYAWATRGHDNLIVLLPIYPLAVRIVHFVVRNWVAAGVLVSNLSCAAAFCYLFLLGRLEQNSRTAARAVLFLATFPTAYFLHAAYSESIFLVLTIAAFYYARRARWGLCGLLAMLATGTRVPGIAILPALAIEYLQQRRFRWREIRWDAAWLALIPIGALVYLWINYHYFGDPLHFVPVQKKVWGTFFRWPMEGVGANWRGMLHEKAAERVVQYGGPFTAFVVLTSALIASPFFLRPTYVVYIALSWVMIFFNNFPVSSPRYLLAVFPIFMLMAQLCRRAWLRDMVVFVSVLFYAICTMHFVRGWWAY